MEFALEPSAPPRSIASANSIAQGKTAQGAISKLPQESSKSAVNRGLISSIIEGGRMTQLKAKQDNLFSKTPSASKITPIQLMADGYTYPCNCPACNQATVTTQLRGIVQRTCDEGHKAHPKGPCPKSAAGKVNRMAKTHGGGKPHGKDRPKARQEKYDAESLKKAQDKMDKGGGGGAAGAAGGAPAATS